MVIGRIKRVKNVHQSSLYKIQARNYMFYKILINFVPNLESYSWFVLVTLIFQDLL